MTDIDRSTLRRKDSSLQNVFAWGISLGSGVGNRVATNSVERERSNSAVGVDVFLLALPLRTLIKFSMRLVASAGLQELRDVIKIAHSFLFALRASLWTNQFENLQASQSSSDFVLQVFLYCLLLSDDRRSSPIDQNSRANLTFGPLPLGLKGDNNESFQLAINGSISCWFRADSIFGRS